MSPYSSETGAAVEGADSGKSHHSHFASFWDQSIEFETLCIFRPKGTLFLNVVKITKQKLENGHYYYTKVLHLKNNNVILRS